MNMNFCFVSSNVSGVVYIRFKIIFICESVDSE